MTAIEDYAMIGDRLTAALVSSAGSIDWLCLPNFDSPACFAALLGEPSNGRWLLGAVDPIRITRRYIEDSLVLVTEHETATGVVQLIDSMPAVDGRTDVVRRIECVHGEVEIQHEWIVRFGYGKVRPWVHRRPDFSDYGSADLIAAVAGPEIVVLRGPRLPRAADGVHRDTFTLRQGDQLIFEMTSKRSYEPLPEPVDVRSRVHRSMMHDREWIADCSYEGPYRDVVRRSLLTLRALTHAATGGIAAAATTSLPEEIGGERNWDYRYCWLRDAAHTIEAMIRAGLTEAAQPWRAWLLRAVAGDPADMQIMYTLDGGRELPEREVAHLAGYENSRPVRIGNGAVDQRQTDVLGEVLAALSQARDAGIAETSDSWALQRALINDLCEHWDEPDNGLWEIRGPQRHFTHSRVMVWAALNFAIDGAERHGLPGDVARWSDVRERVRDEIMTKGFDAERGTFTQYYGTTEVDASLLAIPTVGFLDARDEKFRGTVAAIEEDLMRDGLLLRYRTSTGVDGVAGDESPFLVCSFWLVSAYSRMGRLDEARALMDRLVGLCNGVGLLSEEYDVRAARMLGNFPQAFSHLGLVLAACDLAAADAEANTDADARSGDARHRR